MFTSSLNRLCRRFKRKDQTSKLHKVVALEPLKVPPIISRRLYATPGPDYNAPIAVLRARKEAREQILKQDLRRENYVAAHRNMLAITELDKIIRSREEECDKLSQNHRANYAI